MSDGVTEIAAERWVREHPDVSRETYVSLQQLTEELKKWSRAINLVSRGDLARLWSRHIADSLGLLSLTRSAKLWMDIGSGGGFPALPLAIVSRETSPDLAFVLVESDQRKAAFLRQIAHRLHLNVRVEAARIEDLPPISPCLISARAWASVAEALSWTENHHAPCTAFAFPKGPNWPVELTAASERWHMRYQAERHAMLPNSYMLIIRDVQRADDSGIGGADRKRR